MRWSMLFAVSLLLGCAHQANGPVPLKQATTSTSSVETAPLGEAATPPQIDVGDSVDEVRRQLGPNAIEELLSPSERAFSAMYGDHCGGDLQHPSARTRAAQPCGTARLLKVTLRNDRVIAVEWFEPPRQ